MSLRLDRKLKMSDNNILISITDVLNTFIYGLQVTNSPAPWWLSTTSCKMCSQGCHNFETVGAENEHDRQYQESHHVLLKNEGERLRGLFNKVCDLH